MDIVQDPGVSIPQYLNWLNMYIALHQYCIATTKRLDTDTAVEAYRTTLNISNAASLVVSMSCSKMNCFKAALSCIVYKHTF